MAKAKPPFRIVWRPMAEVDLDTIIDSISRDNPTGAETFGQELRGKTLPLAQQPKMGRTGRPDLPAFVHELVAHRNYIVFYRVLDGAATVEVLRVKHAAQQMP
ncbi:type II toxin-antitoxin system RelE/ParE family toxin [Gluconacetobacter sp. 1b LMG 1731]|uniref:Type II toxin-antitoxin system RelE/ParE family toxin n=1 Tax=Gluconacetobacter dulcium TaxID=2729096 RepID=A0A7W4NSF9_9PROT|nr:type II toxin-antitoxin system RelE/ParE family toxin [Gluconacetobacter dulcium]MBB2164606.1 type II toxin-antitoxin system RelE/ParE family toxin [Gluconacetobacter dulcium]MBB2193627.1 type II toxin-antitoxin system RelE/ParE family toxin [Gluconacetobacter dulcium]